MNDSGATDNGIANPSIAQVVVAVDRMNHWSKNVLILVDSGWDNAYVQVLNTGTPPFGVEYRDGATQMHFKSRRILRVETVKLLC